MSDVERIVNANHERVRWAEEYEEGRIATAPLGPRNDIEDGLPRRFAPRNDRRGDKRRRAMRAGSLVCAMVSGTGAAFLGMGIAMQHQATILLGALIASVFLLAGSVMEMKEEGDTL